MLLMGGGRRLCELTFRQYCTITPQSEVPAGATVPDHTVIYGNNMRRLDKRGVAALMNKAQLQQIAVLRTKIPSNPAKFQ